MIAGSDTGVVEGREGWLFLAANGSIPVLEQFADTSEWRHTRLPRLVASYEARSRAVRARGVPFLVVVAPEACGVMPDMLPPGRSIDLPTRAEQFANRLRAAGVDVVCPSAALRAARGPIDTYQRLDSHWTPYGAFLCWEAMKPYLPPTAKVGWRDVRYSSRVGYGDLSVQLEPQRIGPVHFADLPGIPVVTGPNVFDRRERNVRRTTCATGAGRALVFRDSFGNALAPYLERAFAETILVGGSPAMPMDALELFKPDVVILEVAERTLLLDWDPFADWPARTFDQMFHEKLNDAVGGRYQAEATAAIAAHRPLDAIAPAAVAIALGAGAPRVHNLVQALMDAGQADPALLQLGHTLCAALAPGRNDRYLHYLHAQLSYMTGREPEARTALARAIELQPDNALYLYALAAWDYLSGRHAESLATMRRSIAGAPAHLESWRLAILCAREIGPALQAELEAEAAVVFPGVTF